MDKLFKPWTTLSPAPPKFQSCFLLPRVETGGQNKSNPTAWHITHTFFNFDIWGRGCRPILSSRFEYFVHLRSRNVGCLWDASILCRKNGMITYIQKTSNSFLNFCFLLHHHMSSKGSMTLGDLFDMDMDLGSHKTSQQWTSCRQCCAFPAPFCLACDMVVFLHGFLLLMHNALCFHRAFFTCRAKRLCFYKDSCY